jgi:alpha-glucosidase
MRRYCLTALSIAWICCSGQVTFRIVQLPPSTPDNAEIYLSGNFEGWTGGQDTYQLEKDVDSLYAITLPQMVGTIQFKFTRGSWASVEKGPNGEEISNRVYTFGGDGDTVNITIHNWADVSGITSTASDNVSLLDSDFFMPQLNRSRKIWLYLPPGYDTSQQAYPVMYMHDGQNLFDDSTSFAGEWGVDETLNELYDESGFGMIVVGIENGGGLRIDEYSPWIHPQYGGGEGEA